MTKPTVVIIAGSKTDESWVCELISGIGQEFRGSEFKWDLKWHYASAHHQTRELLALLDTYNAMERVIFVTVAGRSNALSGVVGGNTEHPVIACPPLRTEEEYLVDIHSTLRMPSKMPVMTVLGTKNCSLAVKGLLRLAGVK